MNGSEKQTTKSPKIAFLPAREMRGCKHSKDSTPLSLVRPPLRDYFLLVPIFCDRNDCLLTKENFEKFVLLRENETCLKKSIFFHELRIISKNVSKWCFFSFDVYLFLLLFIFIIFFTLVCNCFF